MGNNGARSGKDEVDESTTLVRIGSSGARMKASHEVAPDSPKLASVPDSAPRLSRTSANPKSDEFALASMVLANAPPVVSSGMAGPYHLALEVASGGMATVYLAVHGLEGFQNTVAVKRIHPHLAKDKAFVDMFVDEAHIAARINHPYVCRVFDFGKAGDSYYIAMEFLRGEPLSRVFKMLTPERIGNPRHPTVIARIIANLAEGLHAVHTLKDTHGDSLDVVHRDITPQNLFVLCDGTVRVTDFGIARARVRSHQTEGGKIKGKLSYMSPEQLNQHSVDCRTDIWSLGVVAWELLTGRRLFRAMSEGETVMSVLSRPIPPPSRFAGSVPRQLDAIVLRALSRDPELRYPSARELVRAIEGFLATSGDTVPTMDIADWVEELFPGAAARADGLVRLAHAVVPPELRNSAKPGSPASAGGPAAKPTAPPANRPEPLALKAATNGLRTTFNNLVAGPREVIGTVSENGWSRRLLQAAAVLVVLGGGVFAFRSHDSTAPLTAGTPEQTAPTPLKAVPVAVVKAAPAVAAPAATPSTKVTLAPSAVPEKAPLKLAIVDPSLAAKRTPLGAAPAPSASAAVKHASLDNTGSVRLMTRNGQAEVYLGGRMLGITPITLDLPPGTNSLLLKPVAGGESRTVSVAIQTGAVSLITVTLADPSRPATN